MICYNCGKDVVGGVRFCPFCGCKQEPKGIMENEKVNENMVLETGETDYSTMGQDIKIVKKGDDSILEQAIKKTKNICVTFIVIGIFFLLLGFWKNIAYSNPEGDDWSYNDDEMAINAYVGGDAYNYIINGTKFTANAVIGTGFLIMATVMGGINICLSVQMEEKKSVLIIEHKENVVQNNSDQNKASKLYSAPVVNVVKGKWTCPDCKELNAESALMCKSCGRYR